MSEIKDDKKKDIIKKLAADFLQRESNRTSLITVTDVGLSNKGSRATIFFTVLPEDKQKAALDFTKRMRSDFQEYAREKARMHPIPFFDFEIDKGEKNRQRIEEISQSAISSNN